MPNPDREMVKALKRKRYAMRTALFGGIQQAKQDLHPRTLIERWKNQKRQQLSAITESGKQNLAKNAPLIGFAGAAILLFSVRKPISKIIQNLRNTARQPKDDKP